MTAVKIKQAQLHNSIFVPGVRTYDKSLELKDKTAKVGIIDMLLSDDGTFLVINFQSDKQAKPIQRWVPITNVSQIEPAEPYGSKV